MLMANEPFGFVAFRSRQQTTAMESSLKKKGISCRIINTPHEIGMGCGLSVRFSLDDTKAVQTICDAMKPTALIGFYRAEKLNDKLDCKPLSRVLRVGNC